MPQMTFVRSFVRSIDRALWNERKRIKTNSIALIDSGDNKQMYVWQSKTNSLNEEDEERAREKEKKSIKLLFSICVIFCISRNCACPLILQRRKWNYYLQKNKNKRCHAFFLRHRLCHRRMAAQYDVRVGWGAHTNPDIIFNFSWRTDRTRISVVCLFSFKNCDAHMNHTHHLPLNR